MSQFASDYADVSKAVVAAGPSAVRSYSGHLHNELRVLEAKRQSLEDAIMEGCPMVVGRNVRVEKGVVTGKAVFIKINKVFFSRQHGGWAATGVQCNSRGVIDPKRKPQYEINHMQFKSGQVR